MKGARAALAIGLAGLPSRIFAASAHDALQPAGPQAAHIADLWWITLATCSIVFVVVLAALAWAVWRSTRGKEREAGPSIPEDAAERRVGKRVGAAVALATLLLVGLLGASIATDRALANLPIADALAIHVTAHQWWWEVTYDDADPTRIFATANEIHVPVGRPVIVTLDSSDVIHSFWVPNLHGKKDLIPGRTATIRFRADQAGEYHGQCAEFCGWQHAFMAFEVFAMAPDDYERWADAQRTPAADPSDAVAKRGRELFMSGSCMLCHAIEGTSANAHKAPDLTHLASRTRLAAGRLPNTPHDLAAWIADPQKIKPGVNMPAHLLPEDDMNALVAYLGTLK